MSSERVLSPRQKRLIVEALKMASMETLSCARKIFGRNRDDGEMAKLAEDYRELATELDGHLVELVVKPRV